MHPAANIRCLPPATGSLPADGGVQLASPAEPTHWNIEHAGHAYQDLLRLTFGTDPGSSTEEEDAIFHKRGNATTGTASKNDYANDPQTQLKRALLKDTEDFYDLLELSDKRWRATADDIKKAFRKVSLVYHPDKVTHLGEEALRNSEAHFKKVKKAYDILSDKKKRASYDSVDDVDDSIPSEASVRDTNFYSKLGPVFDLNSRWSVSDRVPSLGDERTPMSEVDKFYDFWYSFKTWRDFSFDLEYDVDQADCREEKRWMERQNQKHVKARKLEEAARIRRLVDIAYKNDPRVRHAKEEIKREKEAAKLQRRREREAMEKAEQERIASLKAEEERKLQVEREERARAKKEKDLQRQANRKARQNLRNLFKDRNVFQLEEVSIAVERCCKELESSSLDALVERLQGIALDDKDAVLSSLMQELDSHASNSHEASLNGDMSEANESHISQAGELNRDGAKQDEVIKSGAEKVTKMNEHHSGSQEVGAEWSTDEMKRLTKALSKFPPGTRDRYEKLAVFVGSKDANSVLDMVNAMRAKKRAASAQSNSKKPSVVAPRNDFEKFQTDKKKGVVVPPPSYSYDSTSRIAEDKSDSKSRREGQSSASHESAHVAPSSKPPNATGFTAKQQVQLESAMKRYPPSLGRSRWEQISAEVSGRSSAECESRFKELVAFYRAKKAPSRN